MFEGVSSLFANTILRRVFGASAGGPVNIGQICIFTRNGVTLVLFSGLFLLLRLGGVFP